MMRPSPEGMWAWLLGGKVGIDILAQGYVL